MINIPMFHFKGNITDLDLMALGEPVFDLTSDHSSNDPVFTEVIDTFCQCLDCLSISDYCYIICNIRYFVELM